MLNEIMNFKCTTEELKLLGEAAEIDQRSRAGFTRIVSVQTARRLIEEHKKKINKGGVKKL